MWDLGTEGDQHQLLIPTALVGATAANAEQAHKITLHIFSDTAFSRGAVSFKQLTKRCFWPQPGISML